MGAFIATLIGLILVNLIWALVRKVFYSATGGSQPLPRRDNQSDDLARGLVKPGEEQTELPLAAFPGLASPSRCPLHASPYLGYSTIRLWRRERVSTLYLIGCRSCFEEATRHMRFLWHRGNSAQHPVWASAQIYPHLLEDATASIEAPFVAFDDAGSLQLARDWISSPDPELRVFGIRALRFRKSDANAPLVIPFLADKTPVKSWHTWGKSPYVSHEARDVLRNWGLSSSEVSAWEAFHCEGKTAGRMTPSFGSIPATLPPPNPQLPPPLPTGALPPPIPGAAGPPPSEYPTEN